tara:strand:- start:786 stop:1322 length:537 start_codon:yes stop_codon:yes gene_type:complete
MAIAKRSNTNYTKELALNKKINVEQNFAEQVYIAFREKKFGISPCCFVDYESSVINHFLCDWQNKKTNKTVLSTSTPGVFVEPLAQINSSASLDCPASPSNVCTVLDLEELIKSIGTYTECFSAQAQTWTITHNLGKYPSVTVVDNSNVIVVGNVDYLSTNVIQITFEDPFSGCAFLN